MESLCHLVSRLTRGQLISIETSTDSPYRKAFSEAILKLSEKGQLIKLKDLHWKPDERKKCVIEANDGTLGMDNVGGVFYVLGGGLLIAFIVAIFEFMFNVGKIAIEQKVRLVEESVSPD
jgi:glutamate receptor, ionotropic, invertebrate